jgi:hypothetical protein
MNYFIVNYNTSLLVNALINNIFYIDKNANIVIFDNSDKEKFKTNYTVTVLDNTENKILDLKTEWHKITKLPYDSNGSWKHAMSVEWFFENTENPFILLDSDVIIKKEFSHLIQSNILFAGDVSCNRVLPMFLYINVPLCKEKQKKFFDGISICPFKEVDTGYYFYNICKNDKYLSFNMFDYIYHLGGASYKAWCKPNYKINIFGDTFGHSEIEEHKKFIFYCKKFIPDFENLLLNYI